MNPFAKPFRRALLGLAVTGFAALAACEGADAPVVPGPSDAGPTAMVNGVRLIPVAPSYRALWPADATTAQRVSARDGATITSSDAQLIVVPGSIPDDTMITMKAENTGYVSFRFGPSGLQFGPAATLTIKADKANLDGIDPSTLGIAGAHDDGDDWQVIGGTYDALTNTVTVPIAHFSRYALCVR